MKVNLRGLFRVIASNTGKRQPFIQGYLDEVYEDLQEVLDGRLTIEEFAKHYRMTKTAPANQTESEAAQ